MHRSSVSHPVRVRGLKLESIGLYAPELEVAPRAGAWIETITLTSTGCRPHWSHPVRVRGLKPPIVYAAPPMGNVAPRAGAWIETVP